MLLLTGKTLGVAEIQVNVGELVRSLTVGELENVPIARNCPVSCKLPTVIELGIMVSETRSVPPAPPPGSVITRVALELTGPLNAIALAVMVAMPVPTAVATPEALTVATSGALEIQVTVFVTFCREVWLALPYVPMAVNCAV
jgi:hypothetical protein